MKRMNKPIYPKKEKILVSSKKIDCFENIQQIINYFQNIGIELSKIFIEKEDNCYYECGNYKCNVCGYRDETDDEFNKKLKKYIEKLNEYNKWFRENGEALKIAEQKKKEERKQILLKQKEELLKKVKELDKKMEK